MAITQIKGSNINADAVDDAHLATGIDAGKLINALPALDGGSLTGVAPTKTTVEALGIELPAANLTGSIDAARVPAGAVTQHVQATDLTAVHQSIATLGLHMGVADNKAAYNLPYSFIDTFEDNSGTTTRTDVSNVSEYFASISSLVGPFTSDANTKLLLHMEDTGLTDSSSTGHTTTITGNAVRSSTQAKFGTYSAYMTAGNIKLPAHADFNFGTGDFTIEGWVYYNITIRDNEPFFDSGAWGSNNFDYTIRMNATAGAIFELGIYNGTSDRYKRESTAGAFPVGSWQHIAVSRTSGVVTLWRNGLAVSQGVIQGFVGNENMTNGSYQPRLGSNSWLSANAYFDEFRISNVGRYTAPFTPNEISTTSATGTLVSAVQTAPAATTEVSGVILYKDNGSGASTLGTHLKIYLTANLQGSTPNWTGTNWTDVGDTGGDGGGYGTAQTFSGTTKQVKLGKTTVTSGTQVAMKAVWASQASGTLETQLHGWAVNY